MKPVRVVFLGGEWSAGGWTKENESVASRFKLYLEQFTGRKVEVRNQPVKNLSDIPTKLDGLLKAQPADFVFFFCDHSGVPIHLASEKLAPWESKGNTFSEQLGRQIGAIRLATDMRRSPLPEDVLLAPLSEMVKQSSEIATRHGAKFVLLWSGFPITQMSWNADIPEGWPYNLVSALNIFKTRPLVSAERMMLHFRRGNIPFVANLQISRYFSSLRLAQPASAQAAIWSPKATDNVAKMLATSVVAIEF